MADALTIESCVCGYHYYQDIWEPVNGEQLECAQEPGNLHDRYAVTVLKGGIVVGYVGIYYGGAYYTLHGKNLVHVRAI